MVGEKKNTNHILTKFPVQRRMYMYFPHSSKIYYDVTASLLWRHNLSTMTSHVTTLKNLLWRLLYNDTMTSLPLYYNVTYFLLWRHVYKDIVYLWRHLFDIVTSLPNNQPSYYDVTNPSTLTSLIHATTSLLWYHYLSKYNITYVPAITFLL